MSANESGMDEPRGPGPGDVIPHLNEPPPLPPEAFERPADEPRERWPRRAGASPADPWAHRRGEPRVFAFLWTMYVLIAVAGSVLWVARFASVSAGSYGPAARIMLVVIAAGATVLWPMVRLSQIAPREPIAGHILADVLVVLLPVQFVLWPLIILAGWPALVILGVEAQLCAWVCLVGGLLTIALTMTRTAGLGDAGLLVRSGWMVVVLLIVGLGPMTTLGLSLAQRASPAWLPMMSPFTGIPAVTGHGISGPEDPISGSQWRTIATLAIFAAGVWAIAGMQAWVGRRPRAA